jgi:hypothetical protein
MNLMKFRALVRIVFVFALGVLPGLGHAEDKTVPMQWPTQGTVDFRVTLGEGGLTVGQAQHSWSHDSEQYQMRLDVDTTGIAALLRKLGYVQQSRGEIEKNGLRPQRFDVTQLGKKPEAALFDWNAASGARVSIRRGERERRSASLAAGDQDLLSIWHQVGILDKLPENLLVVGNKDARRVQIVRLEENDSLQVPAGRFATRRFSVRSVDGQIKIDLWLARDHAMVPVRAILADAKSETLVLEATALRIP